MVRQTRSRPWRLGAPRAATTADAPKGRTKGATTTLSNRDGSGLPSDCGRHHFFLFLPLDLPASDIAIAIACFCGYPSCMRRLMFELIAFLPDPFFNGMATPRRAVGLLRGDVGRGRRPAGTTPARARRPRTSILVAASRSGIRLTRWHQPVGRLASSG